MNMNGWFEVDRKGLRDLVENDLGRIVACEAIANAWDEEGVTNVTMALKRTSRRMRVAFVVEDDAPGGFADLDVAYTLFANTAKRRKVNSRGRFTLGEKLFLSFCDEAEIRTTGGRGVKFKPNGKRARIQSGRDCGSVVSGFLKMSRAQMQSANSWLRMLIPPEGIKTVVNGKELTRPKRVAVGKAVLPTLTEHLTPTRRRTAVEFFHASSDGGWLYEMGIPVVALGDIAYHVNVGQRIPLPMTRDSVKPHYLRAIHAALLEHLGERLSQTEAARAWVSNALHCVESDDVVKKIIGQRFGRGAVSYDPSNREANAEATVAGVTVVTGGSLPRAAWERVRAAGALAPAGQKYPTGIKASPDGEPPIPVGHWGPEMKALAAYAVAVVSELLGYQPHIEFYSIRGGGMRRNIAWWGGGTLGFNLAAKSAARHLADQEALDALLIHEAAHDKVEEHLSHRFHAECCRLGARMHHVNVDFRTYCGRHK